MFNGFVNEYPVEGARIQKIYDEGFKETCFKCYPIIAEVGVDPANYEPSNVSTMSGLKSELRKKFPIKSVEKKEGAACTGLGNVQLARKNFTDAITTLQKATELQPGQAEAWLALGQAHAVQGNKTEASAALNKCLQVSQPGPLHTRCEQVRQQLGAP